MEAQLIERLALQAAAPAITILCPLDLRRPGNAEDRLRFERLRRDAEAAAFRYGGAATTATLRHLDEAVAMLDLAHPVPAIAVLAAPDTAMVIPLGSSCLPLARVGHQFAIGELLAALQHEIRARGVLLARRGTRCLEVWSGHVVERLDGGFPVTYEPPVEADTPHRDFPRSELEDDEEALAAFRVVDRALRTLDREEPADLVVIGSTRDLAWFDQVTTMRDRIIGRVIGGDEHASATRVAAMVHGVVEDHRDTKARNAARQARQALGWRAVAGVDEVWSAARIGRGHRLLVEEHFHIDARGTNGHLVPIAPEDPDRIDVVDDAIAEVISHDGEVVFTPADALADLGRIALVTRY